jgi:AhpC/TSA family
MPLHYRIDRQRALEEGARPGLNFGFNASDKDDLRVRTVCTPQSWRRALTASEDKNKSAMPSPQLAALADEFVKCRDLDAPLNERLDAYSSAVRKFIPSYANAIDQLVARLLGNGAGANAPQSGELMPAFVLPDETGRLTSLDSLLRNGPVAITFHRGHWCPWCRISASVLAKAHHDITGTGAQLAAVMPDRQAFAAEFLRLHHSPCLRT